MQYYETIDTREVNGFTIILSVTPEDMHPRDSFDDTVDDIDEMCRKIDAGLLDWFIVRVQALKNGIELGTDYLGGNLYTSCRDFIEESGGYYQEMIDSAIDEAKKNIEALTA
jgi:hypothetical protein